MRERIAIFGFCLLVALAALAAAGWVLISGQIVAQGLDAIFLLCICLLAALAFGALPAMAVRQGLLKDLLKRPAKKPAGPRAAAATVAKPQERAE